MLSTSKINDVSKPEGTTFSRRNCMKKLHMVKSWDFTKKSSDGVQLFDLCASLLFFDRFLHETKSLQAPAQCFKHYHGHIDNNLFPLHENSKLIISLEWLKNHISYNRTATKQWIKKSTEDINLYGWLIKGNNNIIYGDFENIFKELAQNTNNIASIKYLIPLKPNTFNYSLNIL